jgi:hypothetical protein
MRKVKGQEQVGKAMFTRGVELIGAERERQLLTLGYDGEHDAMHKGGELVLAAAACALVAATQSPEKIHANTKVRLLNRAAEVWPWDQEKLDEGSALANLIKAGALIAAEVDRVLKVLPGRGNEVATEETDKDAEPKGEAGDKVSDKVSDEGKVEGTLAV